jgi:hypothetical protein
LDKKALEALQKMSYTMALVILQNITRQSSAIRDMNTYIVKQCQHQRNQWGLDDPSSSSSSSSNSSDDDESD